MARLREQLQRVRSGLADESGAATAEYAIATMAAVEVLWHTSLMTIRAAIYVRQSVREDDGIQQQLEACRAYVGLRKDWQEASKPYVDNFTSATKERGTGTEWSRMLADFDRGLFDVIVAVSVDRLLRRVVDVLEVTTPKRQVRVVTARDGIDTRNPLGKVILTILTALAEAEIENKTERSKPYALNRHTKGHPNAGKVPHGYAWIPKPERIAKHSERRYSVVKDEADQVKSIFEKVIQGDPLGSIARQLNASGSTTRAGSPWRSSTIRRIALSPFYAALLPPMRNGRISNYRAEDVNLEACSKGDWDPIVTQDEVRVARAILLNPARRENGGKVARKWLLSGHARCGATTVSSTANPEVRDVCGEPVRSARSREGHHAYRCPRGHFLRRGELLNEYVADAIVNRLSEPDARQLVRPSSPLDLPALRAREILLKARIGTYLDLVDSGSFSVADIKSRKSRDDEELAEIRDQLADAARADPLAGLLDAEDLRAAWDALPLFRKQAVIRALVVVIISPVGKGRRITSLEGVEGSVHMAWRHNRADSVDVGGNIVWTHPLSDESLRELSALLT